MSDMWGKFLVTALFCFHGSLWGMIILDKNEKSIEEMLHQIALWKQRKMVCTRKVMDVRLLPDVCSGDGSEYVVTTCSVNDKGNIYINQSLRHKERYWYGNYLVGYEGSELSLLGKFLFSCCCLSIAIEPDSALNREQMCAWFQYRNRWMYSDHMYGMWDKSNAHSVGCCICDVDLEKMGHDFLVKNRLLGMNERYDFGMNFEKMVYVMPNRNTIFIIAPTGGVNMPPLHRKLHDIFMKFE
jgi:hypothetical protein